MIPRFEVAVGLIDGVNTTFSVSRAYSPQSLAVYLNGQLKRADYADGWIETSAAGKIFDLKVPPQVGDDVQAFYLDTSPLSVEQEVTPIHGTIQPDDVLVGAMVDIEIQGKLQVVW